MTCGFSKALRRASLSLLVMLGACGHSSVLKQDERGGVLVLNGEEGAAMKDANQRMERHCAPKGYKVVKRERVTVGQEQYATQRTDYQEQNKVRGAAAAKRTSRGAVVAGAAQSDQRGAEQTTVVSGVRDVQETRLTYQCTRR